MVNLFAVEYYEKSDGTHPAEAFILSQDNKMQAKLFRLLELLELKGMNCGNPIRNRFRMAFLKSEQFRGTI